MNEDNLVRVFKIEEKKRVVIYWEDFNWNKIYDRKYCLFDFSCIKIIKVIYLEVRWIDKINVFFWNFSWIRFFVRKF